MTFIFNTTAFIGEKPKLTPKFGYDFINYTRIIVLHVITIPQLHHFNK